MISQIILKKSTGIITISSFSEEEGVEEISAFDKYIQIVDGVAEIIINNIKHELKIGEGIIIPAHTLHVFHAHERFKMISTMFKSGYEQL